MAEGKINVIDALSKQRLLYLRKGVMKGVLSKRILKLMELI